MNFTDLTCEYDLIVIGGGLSGVAAAVAAKRQGLSVLLIEQNGSLGGALSNNCVYPFMNYKYVTKSGEIEPLSAGIFAEMIARHRELGGDTERGWQPEIFKIMLDGLVVEAGVDVLFHTKLIGAQTIDREITSITAVSKSGIIHLKAKFYVDSSGDGELLAMSGCDYVLGRESDNLCQPMTTCFRVANVDTDLYMKDRAKLQALYKEKQSAGEITNPRENILMTGEVGRGILNFNTTRVVRLNPLNPIDLSYAEIEARRQVLEMYNFLCNNSEAFKNSVLVYVGHEVGVRESRKLKGAYVLTADDLKSLRIFPDSIALGNYEIDIHNPEGGGTTIHYFSTSTYYSIPYRSLLPNELDNLLVAGRCLSATHEAHSAVRIMPICACMGEAAGTAVAEAVHTSKNVHTLDISTVQNTLERNGAFIR